MWRAVVATVTLVALPLSALQAQSGRPLTAEEAAAIAKRTYGPPPPRKKAQDCPKSDKGEDEIVVCGNEEVDQSEFRVKSSAELDPNSREATDDGLPRAPDLSGDGIFKGKATASFGSVPPPAYMFDISELPEAPEGSDADKIAKGEKPAG